MDKTKNQCSVTFWCDCNGQDACVYYKKHKDYDHCKYFDYYFNRCNSEVANVNMLTLELQEKKEEKICPVCGGEGRYISGAMSGTLYFEIHDKKDKCTTCDGTGKIKGDLK